MALDVALRPSAHRRGSRLTVLEQDHGRDRLDAEAHCELLLLVDVDLDEFDLTISLLDDSVEDGRDSVARTAPLGPEIDEYRLVALQHFLLERRFGDRSCH